MAKSQRGRNQRSLEPNSPTTAQNAKNVDLQTIKVNSEGSSEAFVDEDWRVTQCGIGAWTNERGQARVDEG